MSGFMTAAGKLDGAMIFGNAWAIPEDAVKPPDGRVISGSLLMVIS